MWWCRYARSHTIPIDELSFEFSMLPGAAADYESKSPSAGGAYVHGCFLHGCRWDVEGQRLAEAKPRQLFSAAPPMWIKPCPSTELPAYKCFECPLYRTSERRGMLSTTGHSTNFVLFVKMPTHLPADHWVQRGVTLVLSLDD